MNPILYLKYGELTLKKKNRNQFISVLVKNIKHALNEYKSILITRQYDNIMLSNFDDKDKLEIINILKFVPGIYYIYEAYQVDNSLTNLKQTCLLIAKKFYSPNSLTFRLDCRRNNKEYQLNSLEIINHVAGEILNNTNYKVNLKKFDLQISIEIKKEIAIISYFKHSGLGGLPVNSNGRVLVLLSGGIDSPIAAKLLMNRGLGVDFITFITPPHTSEKSLQKIRDLAKTISMSNKICNSKLFVCDFSHIMHELTHIVKDSYRITLMRRSFFKIAEALLKQYQYDAIATGESIGQVASQTIESMNVISSSIPNTLILRPLLTYDKEQIINLAKFYGTYDLSILPYSDSCSLFAPKNPTTKPNLQTTLKLENDLDLLESLINSTIKNYLWKETFNSYEYKKPS